MTVAIEGFGSVGSRLAGLLAEAGARVVAISTSQGARHDPDGLDVGELLSVAASVGSRVVHQVRTGRYTDNESLLALPVDLLVLCARMHSIHPGNVNDIQATLLCAAANNPWPVAIEDDLRERGISFLPEFASNGGGILGTLMAYACFPHEETARSVETAFRRSTEWILRERAEKGISIREAAETLLEARRVKQERQWGRRGVVPLGLALHRRGLVPGPLVRIVARAYLNRRLAIGLEPGTT